MSIKETEEYALEKNNTFLNTLRIENDLFKEDDHVPFDLIRVSRDKDLDINVYKNKDIIFTIKYNSLSQKQKTFINEKEGLLFLISKTKEGVNSASKMLKELKNYMENR